MQSFGKNSRLLTAVIFVDATEPNSGMHNKVTGDTSQTSFKNLTSDLGGDAIMRLKQC